MPFLTARWTNLCLLTYAVPPKLLAPRVPPGLELDIRDGQAFVSLVAFDFADTRVLGVSWPGYRAFAELNLRYYVRHHGERGVVFLREIVARRAVACVARALYNEPYAVAPLSTHVCESTSTIAIERRLVWAGRTHTLSVTGGKPATCLVDSGDAHFFTELRWGFGVDRRGRTIRYEVEHPQWETYRVESHTLQLNWAEVYGQQWRFLQHQAPRSVVFALGSAVSLFFKAPVVEVGPQRPYGGQGAIDEEARFDETTIANGRGVSAAGGGIERGVCPAARDHPWRGGPGTSGPTR